MSANAFLNPRNLPIDELYLKLDSTNSSSNGVIITIKAIDKHWVTNRVLSRYEPPPTKPNVINLQAWKDKMFWYIDDLKWLLTMKYHIFWSHVVYNSDCMDMLVSFLQEANPSYLPLYDDSSILEIYSTIHNRVIRVFTRLIQLKESEAEWMKPSFLASLLYNKFIFTIPILFDLSLLYGTANLNKVSSLICTVFRLQPNYLNDLKTAMLFVKQTFKFITFQVNPSACTADDALGLPEAFSPRTFKNASSKSAPQKQPVASSVVDLVLYLLDTSLTMKVFLMCFPDCVHLFRELEFHLSIIQLYENAIPDLHKKLTETEGYDEGSEPCKQVNLIRMELLDTVRLMLAPSIEGVLSNKTDKEEHMDTYLTMVMDCLSEKSFIKDYQMLHPVDEDLDLIGQVHTDIDPVKSHFILQAIYSNIEDTDIGEKDATRTKSSNGINNELSADTAQEVSPDRVNEIPEDIRTESLISEVKDIMPHLGDGYIHKCLEFYGFNSERVINSILEGTLDESLQKLDETMPLITVDPLDKQFIETGIDRLNIYDNDEFDVMTRDNIDRDKVHKGKKKSKFKNLNDMLNDKSHVKELSDVYQKLGMVSDETDNIYDDEYDDTYDSVGGTNLMGRGRSAAPATEESEYTQRRAFETPRVLRVRSESEEEEEEEEVEAVPESSQPIRRDAFCLNPEELREKRAMQRAAMSARGHRGNKTFQQQRNTDVVGNAKGKGQEKEVLVNRERKNVHKSSRANHNRRAGAQWKRTQGFIPS